MDKVQKKSNSGMIMYGYQFRFYSPTVCKHDIQA
jgi:hypothetical protein